jgi:hypothetical protein
MLKGGTGGRRALRGGASGRSATEDMKMLRSTRIVGLAFVTLTALAVSAAPSHAGGLDLRAGAFFPRADSNLFDDDSELYIVEKDDWRGFSGGAEYSFNLGRQVELGLHVDGYGRTIDTEYRDFTRSGDRPIEQTLKLTTAPVGFTLRFVPGGREGITPYIGVGADLVYYEYEEFGDFIDFDDPDLTIIADAFIDSGTAGGAHAVAGLRVPINTDFSITAEGRYLWAKKNMGEDFRGNEIDLGGPSAYVGVHISF